LVDVQWIREQERDYPGIVEKVKDRFLVEAGIIVRGQAVRLAPEDSGNLKGSITWRTNDEDGGFNHEGANRTGTMISNPSDDEVYIGTNVEYAEYVEYGVRGKPGQSYMRSAVDIARRRLPKRLAELVRAEINFGRA